MSDMKTTLNRNNRLDTMEEKLVNLKTEQLETFQRETEKNKTGRKNEQSINEKLHIKNMIQRNLELDTE